MPVNSLFGNFQSQNMDFGLGSSQAENSEKFSIGGDDFDKGDIGGDARGDFDIGDGNEVGQRNSMSELKQDQSELTGLLGKLQKILKALMKQLMQLKEDSQLNSQGSGGGAQFNPGGSGGGSSPSNIGSAPPVGGAGQGSGAQGGGGQGGGSQPGGTNAPAGSASPGSSSSPGGAPSGFTTTAQNGAYSQQQTQQMAQNLVNMFQSQYGLTKNQAIGVVASMYEESNLNPSMVQGGTFSSDPSAAGSTTNQDGYGLAQWGNDGGGGRLPGLLSYAQQNGGLPPSSQAAQVGFMMQELNGPFSNVISSIKNGPDSAAAACQAWTTGYEQASSPNMDARDSDISLIEGMVG